MECALCEIARIALLILGLGLGLGSAPVRTTSIKRDLAGSGNALVEMAWTVSSTGYSMRRRSTRWFSIMAYESRGSPSRGWPTLPGLITSLSPTSRT